MIPVLMYVARAETLMSLLILVVSMAVSSSIVVAGKKVESRRERASSLFRDGAKLFDDGDYVGAIDAFKKAYRLRPHYLVRCNVARCYEQLSNMVEAARHFKLCLDEGGRKSNVADRARVGLGRVKKRIAFAPVNSPGKGGIVYVDGEKVGPAPQRVALNPGSHLIEVRRDGALPASLKITVRGGETKKLTLTPLDRVTDSEVDVPARRLEKPAKPAERDGMHPAIFWTGVGLTAALATASVVLSVRALGAKNDYDESPTVTGFNEASDARLLANIMWLSTAVVGAGTTVVFFFTDFGTGNGDAGETAMIFGMQGRF